MKTMPCNKDCISYVICRQIILNNINYPITKLSNKCQLFANFINIDNCDFKLITSFYPILEDCFKLNFKIIEKQHATYKHRVR